MDYNQQSLIPIIYATEYDDVAREFLEKYFPDALCQAMPVPIKEIAEDCMGLNIKEECLSEELDIYGMTIFDDGFVEIYNMSEEVYENKFFNKKTVIVDPVAYKKTNHGCLNNTIAHECVHWYKHRMYYKMQGVILPRMARICKCHVSQITTASEEEIIIENQATGIAPRILMPKETFTEEAEKMGIQLGQDNMASIKELATIFDVSKQSVEIRLEECGIL